MKYPLISIITPSYNQGQYIEQTILSVLNQTYPNLEYIIIDGGSTDNTLEIIKKYAHRLAFWESTLDSGQAHAIQKGFNRATGDIISWLNSDDLLEPHALFTVAKTFAENPNAGFIYGQCIEFSEQETFPLKLNPIDRLPARYIYEFPYAQPSCFYKRNLYTKVGGIDISLKFAMDYDLFIRFAGNTNFIRLQQELSRFRWHPASKSSTMGQIAETEKRLVFSTFLHSVEYAAGIDLLKNLGIWLEPNKIYNFVPDNWLNKTNYSEVVYGFIKPYMIQWHVNGYYSKVKLCILFIKNNEKNFKADQEVQRIIRIYLVPIVLIRVIRYVKQIFLAIRFVKK